MREINNNLLEKNKKQKRETIFVLSPDGKKRHRVRKKIAQQSEVSV